MEYYTKKLNNREVDYDKIAIDFDGTIHKYSKGWQDGEIYDPPMDDVEEALKKLHKNKIIVIFTVREDYKPIIEWLKKYKLDKYIDEITNTKPFAELYVDDRSIHFTDWGTTVKEIEKRIEKSIKIFGKSLKRIKTNNQLDLFVTLGTQKEFAPGDTRKLQMTKTGKKRWMDADEKKKVAEEKKEKPHPLDLKLEALNKKRDKIKERLDNERRKGTEKFANVGFGTGMRGYHKLKNMSFRREDELADRLEQVETEINEVKKLLNPEPPKKQTLDPYDVLKELKIKVWHRGVNTTNENQADKFYSASKEVASNYSMHKNEDERKYEELKTESPDFPKNPLVLGSKYDLAERIGFAEDPYQQRKFDDIAKKYAEKKGYDAIIYLDGTFEEPELHLFGEVKKEFYELTQKEFNELWNKHSSNWMNKDHDQLKKDMDEWYKLKEAVGKQKLADITFTNEQLKNIRRDGIKKVLSEGKKVPEFVLDDYPELKTKKSMNTIKIFGKEINSGSLTYNGLKLIKAFGQQLGLFNSGPYSREGQTKQGKGGTLQLKRDQSGKGAHWQLMDKKQSGVNAQKTEQQAPDQQNANPQQQGMKLINVDKAYNILSNKLGASVSINDKTGGQLTNGTLQLINVNNDNTVSLFYKDSNGQTQIVNAPSNQAVTQKNNSIDFHFADRDISVELNKPSNVVTGEVAEEKLPSEQAKESAKVFEATRKVEYLLKEANSQRDSFLADLDSIAKENKLEPKSADFRQVSLKDHDEFIQDYLDNNGSVSDMLQGAIVSNNVDNYSSIVSGLKEKGYKVINEDELKNSDTMNYKSIKVKLNDADQVIKEVVLVNEPMYKAMLLSKAGPNYHRETLYSLDYKVEAEKIPELEAIKQKVYTGTKTGKKELIITGGLAGSGKSTAIEKRHYKNKVYIDPDDMKNKLYAEERGVSKDDIRTNPAKYHEESSVLGKHLIREAIRDGRDGFYDATMKGMENIDDLIKFAKSNGYKVKAKFVHIPLEEGIKRDKARGEAGERSLGESLYKKLYSGYPTHKVFFDLQEKFDHVELIDNSQPKGEKPKVIQRVNAGKVTHIRKRKLNAIKKLVGLVKGLRLTLFKAQVGLNMDGMFDKNVKDDYIGNENKTERNDNLNEESLKTEGMEEKIDPRLFTLLEIEDDGNFDPDEHSMMLGLLEENGLITHDLKLTPEGEKAYEKELAELEADNAEED